jgi:catechol 2,3-dioxygenase-like lactoylglutathione lyase family enzyme
MQIKSWAHTALAVRDLDQAIAFYREAFGFKVEFEQRGMLEQSAAVTGIPGQRCDIAHLRSAFSEHTLELVRFHHHSEEAAPQPVAPLRPGQAHVAFLVTSLNAALAKVEELGARRIGGFAEFPGYRSAYVVEPSGSFLELEQIDSDQTGPHSD